MDEKIFWTHREEFLLILNQFLENTISFDEFETVFTLLYYEINEQANMYNRDLAKIEKFQPSTEGNGFATARGGIFRSFEEVEDEICTKLEFNNYVKNIFSRFFK